jgi:GT2 family glycosyltransferase
MDTLAVIVNYNDEVNLLQCVKSLYGQARIVVWDNASTDNSVLALSKKFPDVLVHRSPENVLWTPAINSAIDTYLEDEDYILVSNNDIMYHFNTVEKLRKVAARPEVGIVAPIGSALGGMQDFAHHHGKGHQITNPHSFVQDLPDLRVAYVVGASVMFRSGVYREVGPWDNEMPLGADDHDYCIRLKEHDYHIMVCQSAYVAHKGHASGQKAKSIWDEWASKSWIVFEKKWAGYFSSEEEALKCHWAAAYHPGWEKGTGWLPAEERSAIWHARTNA